MLRLVNGLGLQLCSLILPQEDVLMRLHRLRFPTRRHRLPGVVGEEGERAGGDKGDAAYEKPIG